MKQSGDPSNDKADLPRVRDWLIRVGVMTLSEKRLQLMIPTSKDFEQIVDIDRTLFSEETWVSVEALQERLSYNPEVTHILKDTKTDTVLSYISMSPIHQTILEELITLQIDETSLKPEHFISYLPNIPLDCYIISIGARTGLGIAQQIYAGKLVYALKSYLIELLEKGVMIRRIYTVVTTKEGERLAQGLHFAPLMPGGNWQSAYEDFRRPYILDLEDKMSKSKLVKEYQRHKMNRERRFKRYTRQAEKGYYVSRDLSKE